MSSEYADLLEQLRRGDSFEIEAADAIEALERERDAAFEEGVKSVLYIRCMEHREVPQYNRNEIRGAECPACALAEAVADNAAWWAFVDNLSDYETFSPAGEGLVEDMLQANHPGAALLARMARLEAVAVGVVASLSGAATLNAGHEGYTV